MDAIKDEEKVQLKRLDKLSRQLDNGVRPDKMPLVQKDFHDTKDKIKDLRKRKYKLQDIQQEAKNKLQRTFSFAEWRLHNDDSTTAKAPANDPGNRADEA